MIGWALAGARSAGTGAVRRRGAGRRRERRVDRAAGRPGRRGPDLVGGKGAGLHRLLSLGIRVPAGFVVSTAAFTTALDEFTQARIEAPLRALPAGRPAGPGGGGGGRGPGRGAGRGGRRSGAGRGARRLHRPRARRGRGALLGGGRGRRRLLLRRRARQLPGAARRRTRWPTRCAAAGPACTPRRAVSYRGERDAGAMAVVVQQMVPARAAGVFMTLNPANGDRSTAGLRGRLGSRRAAGLRRGHPGPVRAGQGQRRGAAPGDRRQADPAGPRARRRHRHRGRPRAAAGGTLPERRRADRAAADRARRGARGRDCRRTASSRPTRTASPCCRPGPETVWSRRAPRPVSAGGTALGAVLATLTGGTLDRPIPRDGRP